MSAAKACPNLEDNPLRVIIHVDLDCFYCQVEQKRLNIPREVPCAVQQWGGLIAVNYAARAAGISRFTKREEALKLCPELKLVHVEVLDENGSIAEAEVEQGNQQSSPRSASARGKACLERYRKASAQIFAIFKRELPKAVLEKASIDEAYLDLTEPVADALQRHTELPAAGVASQAPEAAPCVQRSTWFQATVAEARARSVLPGNSAFDCSLTSDVRLAVAARMSAQLRQAVENELDFTVSAGISHNKLLAKLASAMNKPNNQTVIPYRAVLDVISEMPLKKIRNLGGKLGDALEALGCKTAADVQALAFDTLLTHFLDFGRAEWIARTVRGISDEAVKSKDTPKSMLACKSFKATSNWADVEHWLCVLCEELAARMVTDSETHRRRPKNLVVHYRVSDQAGRWGAGTERSRSMQLPAAALPTAAQLVAFAMQLLRRTPGCLPCNRIAVSTNDFAPLGVQPGGKGISAFLRPGASQPSATAQPNVANEAATLPTTDARRPADPDAAPPRGVHRALEPQTSTQSPSTGVRRLDALRQRGSTAPALVALLKGAASRHAGAADAQASHASAALSSRVARKAAVKSDAQLRQRSAPSNGVAQCLPVRKVANATDQVTDAAAASWLSKAGEKQKGPSAAAAAAAVIRGNLAQGAHTLPPNGLVSTSWHAQPAGLQMAARHSPCLPAQRACVAAADTAGGAAADRRAPHDAATHHASAQRPPEAAVLHASPGASALAAVPQGAHALPLQRLHAPTTGLPAAPVSADGDGATAEQDARGGGYDVTLGPAKQDATRPSVGYSTLEHDEEHAADDDAEQWDMYAPPVGGPADKRQLGHVSPDAARGPSGACTSRQDDASWPLDGDPVEAAKQRQIWNVIRNETLREVKRGRQGPCNGSADTKKQATLLSMFPR